jgi:hypothetical protein
MSLCLQSFYTPTAIGAPTTCYCWTPQLQPQYLQLAAVGHHSCNHNTYNLLLLDTTAATTVMSSGLPPDVARPLPSCQHESQRRQEEQEQLLT